MNVNFGRPSKATCTPWLMEAGFLSGRTGGLSGQGKNLKVASIMHTAPFHINCIYTPYFFFIVLFFPLHLPLFSFASSLHILYIYLFWSEDRGRLKAALIKTSTNTKRRICIGARWKWNCTWQSTLVSQIRRKGIFPTFRILFYEFFETLRNKETIFFNVLLINKW